MRKRIFAAIAAGVLTIGGIGIAAPAQASEGARVASALHLSTVLCTGAVDNTYSPGLDFTPNPTDLVVHEDVTCASVLPLYRISGTMDYNYTIAEGSCVQLLQNGKAALTMRWSDGTASVFDVTVSSNMVAGQNVVTQTGTVASGKYAGSTVVREITGVVNLDQCAQPGGVSARTSAITMTILL
jgi:hypothetical protein